MCTGRIICCNSRQRLYRGNGSRIQTVTHSSNNFRRKSARPGPRATRAALLTVAGPATSEGHNGTVASSLADLPGEGPDQSCEHKSSIADNGFRVTSFAYSRRQRVRVNQIIISPRAALKCRQIGRQIGASLPMRIGLCQPMQGFPLRARQLGLRTREGQCVCLLSQSPW